jgi:hypothetical protein
MKTLLALFLAAFALNAADRVVTWNPDKAELSWTSSVDNKTKFIISYRTRIMTANGKQPQRFGDAEQHRMMMLWMAVESYLMQSEDWHANPAEFERQHDEKQILKQPPATNRAE